MKKLSLILFLIIQFNADGFGQSPFKISPRDTSVSCNSNLTMSVTGIRQAIVTSGLVANYPFNGNANNIVNSSSNGTVTNATLTTDRFGSANSAYSFNGTSSNITAVSGFGIDTGSVTLMCWAKPDLTASFDNTLLSLYNTQIYVDYGIRMFTDSTISGIRHRPCIVGDRVGINKFIKNQWNFMAVTYNSITDTMTFYLNGKLISKLKTLGNGSTCNTTTSRLTIGADFSLGSITRYKGMIDDVLIYNRELNINEINQNYGNQPNSILWSTSDTSKVITKQISSETKYWAKVTLGGVVHTDSIQVNINPTYLSLLSDSINVCRSENFYLTAPNGYVNYLWQRAEGSFTNTTQTVHPVLGGWYYCKVTPSNGCPVYDSIYANVMNTKIYTPKTTICKGDSINLNVYNPYWYIDTALHYLTSFQTSKYYILNRFTSYNQAKNLATSLGGKLWVVNSQQENDSVYSKISTTSQFYWMGLYKDGLGSWKWVDGTTLSYTNWSAGEPNNSSVCGGSESFGAINWGGITSYGPKWNDIPDSMNASCMLNRTSRAIFEFPLNYQFPVQINRVIWSNGDTNSTLRVSPSDTTIYWVKQYNNWNQCYDTIKISVVPTNINFLSDSTILCKSDSVLLTAPIGYSSYVWNGLDSNRTIYAKSMKKYTCKINTSNGCIISDSTYVNLLNPKIKADKQIICYKDSITLNTDLPNQPLDTTLQYLTTFQNSKYYSLNKFTTWSRANDVANSLGGKLWVINSQQENDSVYNKIKYNPQFYWMGLFKNPSGVWKWVDSTGLTYTNWSSGEPNNSSYCGGSEYLGCINWGGLASYGSKWNDIPDSMNAACMINRTSRAIIEFPLNSIVNINNVNKIIWSNGDTTQSIRVSPDYTTPYWVRFYNNWNSCTDTMTIQVNKPVAAFHINSNEQCFNTHKFVFYNNSYVNFGTITNKWLFEDGNSDTSINPIKYFTKDSIYLVKLKVTSNHGCMDSLTNTLTLYKNPIAKFGINDSDQCKENNLFVFNNLSTINNNDSLRSYWIFAGTDTVHSHDASKSFLTDGKFNVKLIVLSSKFCKDSMEKSMVVFKKPAISSIIGKVAVKPLSTETYSVSLSDSTIYRWKVLGGNIISGQNNNLISVQWGNVGDGYIGVIATDNKGCLSDSTKLSISITTVGIDDIGLSEKIKVYPNPTNGLIIIDSQPLNDTDYDVSLMDIHGRILIRSKNLKAIDITDYSDGTYYMQIEAGGRKITKKIVKVN